MNYSYLYISYSQLLVIQIPSDCFLVNTKNSGILLISKDVVNSWTKTDNLKEILDEFLEEENTKQILFQELM